MAYINDIVFATETTEDHMERKCEIFQCWRQAAFKIRLFECDFMKSKIKNKVE